MLELRHKHISILVACGVVASAWIALSLAAAVLISNGKVAAMMSVAGAAILLVVASPMVLRRNYDAGEPLTFVLLALTIGVTLKLQYVFLSSNTANLQHLLIGKSPEFLLGGLVAVLVGMTMFTAGYLVRTRPLKISHYAIFARNQLSPQRLSVVGFLVIASSLVAIYLFIQKMGIMLAGADLAELSGKRFMHVEGSEHQTALGYHRWAISLPGIMIAVTLPHLLKSKALSRIVAAIVVIAAAAVVTAFAVFSSSRGDIAFLALTALVIVYYTRRRVGMHHLVVFLGVAVALVILITVLRSARTVGDIEEVNYAEQLVTITAGALHFLDLVKTSHILDATPEIIPYQYGRTLISWIVAPVPRSHWPEKPALGVGPMIGRDVFNFGSAGVPPGFIAELYINFHLVGVGLGMFIYGVVLRWFYVTMRPLLRSANPSGVGLYGIVVLTCSFHLISADFSKFVVSILMDILPFFILAFLVTRRTGSGVEHPHSLRTYT